MKGIWITRVFFSVVDWSNLELYREFICLICYFGRLAKIFYGIKLLQKFVQILPNTEAKNSAKLHQVLR